MRANGGPSLFLQFTDERILGDGDFVEDVLSAAQEQMEKSYIGWLSKVMTLTKLPQRSLI